MTDLPQAYPAYLISFHLPSVMIFTDKTDNEIPTCMQLRIQKMKIDIGITLNEQ